MNPLAGWLCVGVGVLDFLLAAFFYFVRPPADERARKLLPLAFILSGIVIVAVGILFLTGILGAR